jgi:hypothetical protein
MLAQHPDRVTVTVPPLFLTTLTAQHAARVTGPPPSCTTLGGHRTGAGREAGPAVLAMATPGTAAARANATAALAAIVLIIMLER